MKSLGPSETAGASKTKSRKAEDLVQQESVLDYYCADLTCNWHRPVANADCTAQGSPTHVGPWDSLEFMRDDIVRPPHLYNEARVSVHASGPTLGAAAY